MAAPYEIVRYRPELKEQVVELHAHLLQSDQPLSAPYLEWKYERNPYLERPLIYLGLSEGRVVGMRGMCGALWQVGSPPESFLGLCAEDFVIAPEHRNKGLANRIMRAAFEDLATGGQEYVFSLSGGPVTVLASLAMGWKSVGSMKPVGRRSLSRRVISWMSRQRFLWRYAGKRLSARERQPFSGLDAAGGRRRGNVSPRVTLERAPRCEAMAELAGRLGDDGRLRHVRDVRYFSWRFQNPTRVYRFLYWEDVRLEGYLVLQKDLTRANPTRVHIVDWEASEGRVRAELLEAAIAWGGFAELVTWAAAVPRDTHVTLAAAGFEPVDQAKRARGLPCVLVRPVREQRLGEDWTIAGRRLLDPANWDLRMLYSMHG
jgi:GNAT superfamily N-acetyltransferase